MFCTKCGYQLVDGDKFCPRCGAKVEDTGKTETEASYSGDPEDKQDEGVETVNLSRFDRIAIKFGDVLSIIEAIVFFILGVIMLGEGGFWGKAFGILFVVCAIVMAVGGILSLFSRIKKDEFTREDIKKKKRNMAIGIVVIIVAIVIAVNTGGGTYAKVKAISFDNIGSETIGEIVEENIKSPDWSQEKIDGSPKKVSVEGYSPLYGEDIRITFYYEELDGSYEVSLQSITFLDSGETYSGVLDMGLVWASFYD